MHIIHSDSHEGESSLGKRIIQSPALQAGLASLTFVLILILFHAYQPAPKPTVVFTADSQQQLISRLELQTTEIVKHLLLLQDPDQNTSSYHKLDELLNRWNEQHQQLRQSSNSISRSATVSAALMLDEQISPLFNQITNDVLQVLSGAQTPQAKLPEVLASEQKLMPLLAQYQFALSSRQLEDRAAAGASPGWFSGLILFGISYAICLYLFSQIQNRRQSLHQFQADLDSRARNLESNQSQLAASISATFHETWSWTKNTGEFWCSDTFWRVFGYSSEAEYPESQFDVFRSHLDPGNRGLLEAAVERHLQSGIPIDLEVRAENQLGHSRWVRIQARTLSAEDAEQLTIVGTAEDIHEYKLTKLQLNQSEKLLSRVGEVAKIGGWHLDLETKELFWTQETYAIHEVEPGYQPSIRNAYKFYAPEARPAIQNALERSLETGESWDLKLPFITAKGKHIWVRAQGELEYEQGHPVRLVGAFQDITEEKQREAEFLLLQYDEYTSRAHLDGVIRAATEVSIIATDHEGIITLFSPGAEQLLGYSAKEMIGMRTPECFHLPEEIEAHGRELSEALGRKIENFETFIALAQQGEVDKREWTYVRKDGSQRTVELTVTAIRDQYQQIEGYLGVAIDITEKKQNEKQLSRLATAVSKSTNGVVITDDQGRVEWVNDRFKEITGYGLEAVIGKTPGAVLQGEKTDPQAIEYMAQKVRAGESFETELINYHQSGTEYWVHIKADPILDADGNLTGFMAIENDITERKQAEQELLDSREKIRHLLDALPVAAYTCDTEGLITYYNQAAADFWGREPQLDHPEDRFCGSFRLYDTDGNSIPHEKCWMALALDTAKTLHGGEIVVESENGQRKTALAHVSPLFNFEGELTGAVNVLVDISDRMALEKSLREATVRLELCLKVLDQHAIVAETELNGTIRHVNEMFCKVSGYSETETIGKTHRIVNSGTHSQEFWKNVFRTIASEGMWQGEICNRRKNGELYWVDTTIATMKDGEGNSTGYLAIRNDITELKQAQEAALAASQSKSEFLANMSHEIRTPLTAILGYADLLKNDPEFATSARKRDQAVNTIQEAGNHLLTVINDILDLSKIEAQKVQLDYTTTQVFHILDHIESLLRPPATEKGVDLVTRIQNPIPDVIKSDPTRLRQILMNLVGNAVKFTEQGQIQLIVELSKQGDTSFLQFDIQDTGPGMSLEQAQKIFNAFSQADTSVTRQHGGTGLGLVISRKLARLMNGEVSLVRTEQGKGTCFRLTLPIETLPETRFITSRLQDDIENSEKPAPPATLTLPPGTRILLAEDGPDNQRLISFLLKKKGARVDVADNGAIALQKFQEAEREGQPYHLLLTDMQMPEMDGYTLASTLRKAGADLPIVALTAHAMSDDRQKCLDSGCNDYLSKPVNSKVLAKTLLHWVTQQTATETEPHAGL
ncbi:Aerobic respiration control sensor protein ArcB [Gimesia panareensis]|nr:Aerobic respiration control sensor protein ArcB [Gimesia panareensis]